MLEEDGEGLHINRNARVQCRPVFKGFVSLCHNRYSQGCTRLLMLGSVARNDVLIGNVVTRIFQTKTVVAEHVPMCTIRMKATKARAFEEWTSRDGFF